MAKSKKTNANYMKVGNSKKKKEESIIDKIANTLDDIAPIAKTAGKTALTGLNYLGQGIVKGTEGIMDAGLQLGTSKANPYYWFNPDDLKSHQKIAEELVKKDSTKELVEDTLGGGKDFNKKVLDENSLIKEDNLGGQVVQSIGQMLPGIALGTGTAGKLKEGISLGTMGIQSYGSGIEQAYQQGKDRATANKYGTMNAAIETATEKMFAGFGNAFGKGALDDTVKKKLTGKLSEGISKRLIELGIDSLGEGVEEVASDLLQPIALKLSGMSNEDLGKLYKDQNYLNDFLAGSLSGLAMGGTARVIENNTLSSNEHKLIDEITNRKATEQNTNKFIEKEIQNRINNSDFELNTSQKEQLRKTIENELADGSIQAENILSNKDISGIRKSVKNDLKNGKISASDITDILGNTDFSNDRYISSIFNEENQKTKSFDIDTTDIQNEKVRNLYESAKNKINNTKTSHNFVDAIAKLVEKTDRNYQFTNNQELRQLGLDIDNKTVNGLMQTLKNGEQRILINMDSRQALNTVLGHETTHLLEGTTEYQDLQNSIIEYAKFKGDYEGRLADLTKRYEGIDNVDINSELTADLVGDYLFTDEKFINDLAINKPTLATKIKNVIDNLVKSFKGTNEEPRLKELQQKFNKALDNIGNSTATDTKYMMTSIEGMNNGVKTNDRYLDIKNRYDKAMELSQDKSYSNEDIRKETGWFKDNTGHWEFEISDHKTKFKIKPQINTEYKMSDLFEASTLYDMYPQLKDIKVAFKKMKSNGSYYALNKSIKMNNNLLDNLDNARGTLLHEIQHYIQDVEDLPQGTSLIFGNEQYANSKGEIEAADTKNRRNMTVVERKANIPESSKENPIHPNRENILNHKMTTIEKIGEKLYNKFGDKANEIVEEIIDENQEKDIQSNNRNSGNRLEGLDNSSFSNTKYSTSEDNQGRKLSKQQQEYFKDSKVRDEDGNLEVIYHGTPNDFTVFDISKTSDVALGNGLYFTNVESTADAYANNSETSGKIMEGYLDIKNPINNEEKTISLNDFKKLYNELDNNSNLYDEEMGMSNIKSLLADYGDVYNEKIENILKKYYESYDNDVSLIDNLSYMNNQKELYETIRKTLGIDGIIIDHPSNYAPYEKYYIAFNSNQFKNIDNANPTTNDDIRYSVNDKAPTGDYKVFSKDIKQVQNSIQYLSNQINELKDELAPIKYSVDPYAEFGKSIENDEGYNSYIENLVNEQSNIAPYKSKTPQTYEDFLYDREATKDVRELEQKQQNRIEREPQTRTTREKISDAWDAFQSHFVNRNQQIDKISKITGNNEIKYKGDRVNNIANEISGDVFMAQTDNYGNAIGKSLDAPFEKARELGLSDYFDNYLKHQSNIERHVRGKGSAVVDAETSKKYVKAYETKYPELKEMAKDVYTYNQNLLNNAVENGLITEDFKNQLNIMYGKYVPFYEKNNSEPNTDTSIEEIYAYTPIRSAKGGTDGNLLDIEQAMMKQTYSWKNSIAKNDLYKEIGESLQDKVEVYVGSDPTTFNNTLYADENGKYMTYFLNGEEQAVRISNELYKELSRDLETQIMNMEEKYSVITKPLQKLSDIRGKFLTSYNPSFILRNPIKDVQDALINTKNLKGYLSNYSSSFTDSKRASKLNEYASKIEQLTGESINNINPDELTGKVKKLYDKYQDGLMWNRFITSYGNNAVELQYGGDTIVDMSKKNNKFVQKIKDVNNFMELMSRYPEFKQTIENGGSFTEALYNAREITTNFGRGGTITKAMNRNGATFLNASVQGMDKFIRNFSGQNGSRAFVGAVARAIEVGMIPTIINHLLNAGDDDYEELKDYIKDNYYLFKTGDGKFIRIPKGRMVAVLGSAARRTMEYAGGENEAYEGYLDEVNSQIGINDPKENNIFAPIIQAFGSKNGKAWYGEDLVPSRLQNKPSEEQYDESTDALSIKLGQSLGISPYKVNYVLDQYSGGIGDIVLPMMTKKTTNGAESVADYVAAPIKDAFSVDSTTDNKYPGQIYDLSEKLQTQSNGNKATDFEKVQSKYINAVAHDMNELYAKKRKIQNSDMPNSEKLVEVKAIQDEINALAKKGYDNYQEATMSDTYALIGDKEFRKNTEDEWKSLSKSDVEKLEGATPDEKSEYFYVKNEITNIKDNYKDVTSKEDKISKKREIIESILSSDLNDNLISKIYSSYYSRKASENIYNSGGSMKNFLEYEYDTADFEKEREKINYLYNSGFNNTTKQAIYENKFENMEDEKVSDYEVAINYGVDINSWLKLKSQAFEADVAANGKKISGTKKAKIMSCIQALKLNVLQKALLMKLSYSSYKAYDQQIYEYLEKENMPKSEKEKYAEQIGLIKKG